MKFLMMMLLICISIWQIGDAQSKRKIMSTKTNRFGIEVTHYLTPIFADGKGYYPAGYNDELHRDMGEEECSICHRLFKEHTPEEFLDHFERSGTPVTLTPEQIEQTKDLIRRNPDLTPEQAEAAIKERFPDSK